MADRASLTELRTAAWLAEDGDLGRSDPAKIDFKRIRFKVGRGKVKRR
jgi:hypothetical protein